VVGGLVGGSLVLLVAILLVLRTAWFHGFVLQKIQQEASAKLNTQVRLQNYSLHLFRLTADLYGLTVVGTAPQVRPPLLQVQHIGLRLRIVSIRHGKWYLDRIRIDNPVVRLVADPQGATNVPHISSSGGKSSFNVFQLGVRHAALTHGLIYLDDKKSAIDADLRDLDIQSRFDPRKQRYATRLSYRDGHLQVGRFQSIPHDLQVTFTATPAEVRLTEFKLVSGASKLLLTGTLKDYRQPDVLANYDVVVDGREIGDIVDDPAIPTGTVRASGSISYRWDTSRPLLQALAVEGKLSSPQLKFRTTAMHTQVADISARYSLANGNAYVTQFRANVLGGQLSADATMRDLLGKTRSKLNVSLQGLSLSALQRTAPASAATRSLALAGALNAQVSAAWGQTLAHLVVNGGASLRGNVTNRRSGEVLPLRSAVRGVYYAAGSRITLAEGYVRMPSTTLDLNGTLAGQSSLAVQFHSHDLRELETIAAVFRPAATGSPMPSLGLAGTASFLGKVHGSTKRPHIAGKIVASNLHLKGAYLPLLQSDVDLGPSRVALHNAQVELSSLASSQSSNKRGPSGPVGHIAFDGSAGLSHWAFTKTSPLQLRMRATRMDIATLVKIAGLQTPVAGTLAANIDMHGTVQAPVGHGNVAIADATAFQERIQSIGVAFTGTMDSVHGDLVVHAPAGVLHSALLYRPMERSYQVQLHADNISLDKLQAIESRNMQAKGQLSLDATGQGTFQDPGLTATLQIPQLEIQKQRIADVHLALGVANHKLSASLTSQAIDTSIQAHANIALSGEYMTEANLDTQPIALGPLLAAYAPSVGQDVTGETEVHATVRGPLKQKDLLTVRVVLPRLHVAYGKSIQLAATSPVEADYSKGVVALRRTTIQGTDTNLQLQGSLPLHGNAPVSVLLLGTVDLQLARLFDPEVRSSGNLIFNINTYGARKDPNVEGEVAIVNANFSSDSLPIGLQHGNGVLSLTKDRLNIKSFQGQVGGGTLTAQGGISYRPTLQFDLGAAARNIRMLYPQGLREELSADLRLTGNERNAMLGGAVRVSNISFTPAFDLTSFIGNISSGVAAPPTPGFSQDLHLNLAVSSTGGMDLVSRTLSVNGTANLQVRGTAAEPVILGRINLNDGDVIFNGNRFVLSGGTVAFVNPTQTEPVVNLTLNTTIQQFNIHLRFNGPVDQLRTNYASDPSLPSADIINLLAFGQTTEANAANPVTPADQAAEGLLASQVSSQITNRVSKIAGISQLSINPVLSGGSTLGPAGAIVTVQQRITGNFFVTYSTNVATTQDQVIMGQYQLSPKVAVTGTRDQNGGFAFDTVFKKTW
jgi:translocation and assembly module TamB